MENEIRLLMRVSHVRASLVFPAKSMLLTTDRLSEKHHQVHHLPTNWPILLRCDGICPSGDPGKSEARPPIIIGILEQCLNALKYLHDKGIMHRDIKPANIILKSTYPLEIKLADFGLGTAQRGDTGVAGTFPFIAPEIFAHKQHTPAIDI